MPAPPRANSGTPEPGATLHDSPLGAPLAAGATFLDLLQTVANQSMAGPCVLAMQDGQLWVGVREGLATQGWPPTPERIPAPWLDAPLSAPERLRLLTPWGIIGPPEANRAPTLVAVTEVAPDAITAPAGGLLLDATGRAALYVSDGPPVSVGAPATLGAALGQRPSPLGSLWIAATRATPVSVIAAYARQLPNDVRLGFAIALPRGTRLPAETDAASGAPDTVPGNDRAHCPTGLPAPEQDDAEGALPIAALQQGVAPLQQSAIACLEQAAGPAAAGARLILALRIGAGGRVRHSCLVDDPLRDATLAACVTEYARQLRFPAPTPAGFVDVQLPVTLSPRVDPAPRPYCSR